MFDAWGVSWGSPSAWGTSWEVLDVDLSANIQGTGSVDANLEVTNTTPVYTGGWSGEVSLRTPEFESRHLEADVFGAGQVKAKLRLRYGPVEERPIPPLSLVRPLPTFGMARLGCQATGRTQVKAKMTVYTAEDRANDNEVVALAMSIL